MRRIRIGNDIILRIRLTRRGGAENLEGKKIGLMLRNILGSVSLPVVQSGEELIAGWQGTQQQWTGAYTVTLTEDWGENNRNTVDEACAFELVSISSDEGVETGTVNIELDMDISVPGNGLSAYEIAVLYGFEGTEEEWLESLTPDANYYNKQEIEENYYNKGEIDEYIKEHQHVIPHPKYVVGKNSDSEFLIDVSEYDGFDDNDETKILYFYEEEGITINSDGTYKLNSRYRDRWTSDEFYKRDRNKRYYTESDYIPLGFINENNIYNDKILSFYKLLSTKEAIEIGQQNGEYVQSYFYYRDNSNGYFKDKWWSIYAGTPIKNAILDISKLRTSEYIPDIKNMPGDIDRVNIFAMCRNLETVILYSSDPNVTEIEECFTKSMFQGCKNLKKVVFRGVKPKNSAFLFDRIDNKNYSDIYNKNEKNESSLEIISDTLISFGKGIFQFCPFGEIIGLNLFNIDDSVTDLSYCFGSTCFSKDLLLPSCFLRPNNVEKYSYFIRNFLSGLEKINVVSEDGTIKNQEYGIYIPIIPSENVNSIQVDNLVDLRDINYPMKVEFIGNYVGDKVIKITSTKYILPSSNVKKEIYADEHFEFTDCSYMLIGRDICAYFKTSLTANMRIVFLDLRKFKCSPEFFNTKNTIDFSRGINSAVEGYFGFNDDNSTSNGSLEHIAETAPTIVDGNKRILKFASYLKEAEWAAPYIAQLQEKGYTIA